MQVIALILSLIFNLAIIAINAATFWRLRVCGLRIFKYYTMISNAIAILTSLVFVVAVFILIFSGVPIPVWVKGLRFTSALMLLITALIVIVFLNPLKKKGQRPGHESIFPGVNKKVIDNIFHYVIPTISIVSYIFFESLPVLSWPWALYAIIPTAIYMCLYIVLTVCKAWNEPYGILSYHGIAKKSAIYIPIIIIVCDFVLWWAGFLLV